MADETKKARKKALTGKSHPNFPGDFAGFAQSGYTEKARKKALTTLKLAKQHPVEREHAGIKFLKSGGKREMEAYKKYRKDRADVRDKAKTGRIKKAGGGRTNLLEELGRVEGERSNRNRRAEVSRIHGELNKGYSLGGRVGAAKRGFNKKILRKD